MSRWPAAMVKVGGGRQGEGRGCDVSASYHDERKKNHKKETDSSHVALVKVVVNECGRAILYELLFV